MATKELIKPKTFRDVVQSDSVKSRLKEIMGERGPQFAAALIQIVNGSNQLQKCEPNSIIGAALQAASLDLSVDPNLGEASIVPYGNRATFQIGYIGYNQLAMRSGQYKNLGWKVVHENELKAWDELTGELVVDSSNPNGDIIGYAAKYKLTNGFEKGSYWTKDACFAHAERYSKSYRAGMKDASKRDSVWFTDPDRACLKTVIKNLIKLWGPKSIQLQKALKVDDGAVVNVDTGEVEYLDSPAVADAEPPKFEEPAKAIEAEVAPPPTAKTETPKPAEKSQDTPRVNHVKAMKGFIVLAELKEAEVINYLRIGNIANVKTLEEIDPQLLEVLVEGREDLFAKVKKVREQ